MLQMAWDLEFNGKRTLALLTKMLSDCEPALIRLLQKQDPHLDRSAVKNVLPAITLSLEQCRFPKAPERKRAAAPRQVQVPAGDETPKPKGKGASVKIKMIELVVAGLIPTKSKLTARISPDGGGYPVGIVEANGDITVDGKSWNTPSGAGAYAKQVLHCGGTRKDYPTDGYMFWHFNGKPLDYYRQQLAK